MANNSIYVGNLTGCTNPQPVDKLVIVSNTNANVQNVTIDNFFNNLSNLSITANVMTTTTLVVSTNTTPANSSDLSPEIVLNSIWSDGTYLYHYNGTDIKRVLINTF